MATIDLTVARAPDIAGIRRRVVGEYTGPASYATGGETVSASELGIGVIEFVAPGVAINAAGTIYLVFYDFTAGTVKWYVPNTGAEVANLTDLSGFTVRFEVIGY